jgi:acyl-CoA synthetase (AMP-forming)/AMP-acid ligase II
LWDTYDVETFNKHKPDTMLLFPSNYEQYENLSKLDLSHVRYVLTGGSTIPKTFCEKLIEQGVDDVVVIYGLTECLPPIMHKFVNKQNIADYNQQDMGVNCDDTAEYKIDRHGELVIVKSKHLAKQINDSNVDTLNTGDRVNTVGDNYYFEKRNKDFIRINGELVNPQQLVDESQATKIVLFGTSQTHVVVCVNDDSVNTDSLIQKLTGQGISYDKLIIPIELNVLGKPDIGKLRQKYVSN